MATEKSELHGLVTLTVKARETEGIYYKGMPVRMFGDYEVAKISAVTDKVIGYVLVPNTEDSGELTIATIGHRVSTEEAGTAIFAGQFCVFNASNVLAGPNSSVQAVSAGVALQTASAPGEFIDFLWF